MVELLIQRMKPNPETYNGSHELLVLNGSDYRILRGPKRINLDLGNDNEFIVSEAVAVAVAHNGLLELGTNLGGIMRYDLDDHSLQQTISVWPDLSEAPGGQISVAENFVRGVYSINGLAFHKGRAHASTFRGVYGSDERIYPHITGQLAIIDDRLCAVPLGKARDGEEHGWDASLQSKLMDLETGIQVSRYGQPQDGSGFKQGNFEFKMDGSIQYVAHGNWPGMRTSRLAHPFDDINGHVRTMGSYGFAEHEGTMLEVRDVERHGSRAAAIVLSDSEEYDDTVFESPDGEFITSLVETAEGAVVSSYSVKREETRFSRIGGGIELIVPGRARALTSWDETGNSPRAYANRWH